MENLICVLFFLRRIRNRHISPRRWYVKYLFQIVFLVSLHNTFFCQYYVFKKGQWCVTGRKKQCCKAPRRPIPASISMLNDILSLRPILLGHPSPKATNTATTGRKIDGHS